MPKPNTEEKKPLTPDYAPGFIGRQKLSQMLDDFAGHLGKLKPLPSAGAKQWIDRLISQATTLAKQLKRYKFAPANAQVTSNVTALRNEAKSISTTLETLNYDLLSEIGRLTSSEPEQLKALKELTGKFNAIADIANSHHQSSDPAKAVDTMNRRLVFLIPLLYGTSQGLWGKLAEAVGYEGDPEKIDQTVFQSYLLTEFMSYFCQADNPRAVLDVHYKQTHPTHPPSWAAAIANSWLSLVANSTVANVSQESLQHLAHQDMWDKITRQTLPLKPQEQKAIEEYWTLQNSLLPSTLRRFLGDTADPTIITLTQEAKVEAKAPPAETKTAAQPRATSERPQALVAFSSNTNGTPQPNLPTAPNPVPRDTRCNFM